MRAGSPLSFLAKPSPMRIRSAVSACTLVLAIGLAHAQAPAPAALAVAPAEPAATVAAAPVASQDRSATLRQLGIDYEITLRGIEGSAGVPFSVRTDEVVNAATLHLKYSYSPALLPDLSHLKVAVNGIVVATLPVDPASAGKPLETDVQIDPRLVTDYNQLNLQLIGHYTRDCEDPDHSSLWANIDAASTLSLSTTPVALADDLSLLPLPFFDVRDIRKLELPFYFPHSPDLETLEAAGIVSSWFGTLAGYRGATFPVSTSGLPLNGNAVVIATPSTLPAELATPQNGLASLSGPTVAVRANPNDPNGKLLLVLGRNAAELRQAATAIALRAPLSGAVATIADLQQPQPRRPYDAPKWISSEHPVRFGDLVSRQEQLSVTGYHPDVIRVGLQLPPDLFVWKSDGIPVNLKYRYTVPTLDNKSALNVSINNAFVVSLPLDGRPYAESLPKRWWNQIVGTRGKLPVVQRIKLPTGPFSANSQLRFHFFFDRPQAAECKNTFPDVSGAIDADSSIDLSGFPHYLAMPNLAAFGNAGYPFTRLADLSESAIVLPNNPGDQDFGNVLTLLGRFGASTGYPTLRVQLLPPARAEQQPDRDLVLLGSPSSQPLFDKWRASLPVEQGREGSRFVLTDWLLNRLPGFMSPDARRTDLPNVAEVALKPQPGDVLVMGFESPLKSGRSVVALQSDEPASLGRLFDAWSDPDRLKAIQGSVVLLHQDKVTSVAGDQSYYVGRLPLETWLRWYFSNHPVYLAAMVVALCLLLALAARVLLRLHSAYRLREGRHS